MIKKILNKFSASDGESNYNFVMKKWQDLFDLSCPAQVLETKFFTNQIKPVLIDSMENSTVLILAPHPDDELFGCGGTLMKFQQNIDCNILYFSLPGKDASIQESIKKEALNIAEKLQAKPHFIESDSGQISAECETLDTLINELKPDKVFTTFMLDDHDDHRKINQTLATSLTKTKHECEIWSYQIYSTLIPNVLVDITSEMNKKSELMSIYQSVAGKRDWAHYIHGMNAMNSRYLAESAKNYVETFFVIPSSNYLELCDVFFANDNSKIYKKYYL